MRMIQGVQQGLEQSRRARLFLHTGEDINEFVVDVVGFELSMDRVLSNKVVSTKFTLTGHVVEHEPAAPTAVEIKKRLAKI